jgi:hypothetical protein
MWKRSFLFGIRYDDARVLVTRNAPGFDVSNDSIEGQPACRPFHRGLARTAGLPSPGHEQNLNARRDDARRAVVVCGRGRRPSMSSL